MDKEDLNFLKDLAEELRKINPIYNAEADELENIIFREETAERIGGEIIELRGEFSTLPEKSRYSLGSKGVEIINKIHRLECELEAI